MYHADNIDQAERSPAMFTHLASFAGYLIPFGNIFGPLIVWLMKKNDSAFVDQHGKACINFQISLLIWLLLSGLLCIVLIGFVLIPILLLVDIIFTVINCIRASNGEMASYPLSIPFIK